MVQPILDMNTTRVMIQVEKYKTDLLHFINVSIPVSQLKILARLLGQLKGHTSFHVRDEMDALQIADDIFALGLGKVLIEPCGNSWEDINSGYLAYLCHLLGSSENKVPDQTGISIWISRRIWRFLSFVDKE